MCGIGGILKVHPQGAEVPPPEAAIPEAWLDIIDRSIEHRGPDGAGRFRDRVRRADGSLVDVSLVHRRMSIIDLANGTQPMVSERGREGRAEGLIAVVFNGCIYNHRELRRELEGAGHRFQTDHSDTEVLIHGWRQWGTELSSHLEGMYAYMLWDRSKGELFLGRDLAHEKPLYYFAQHNDGARGATAVFASVPAALMQLQRAMGDRVVSTSPDWIADWVRFGASVDSIVGGIFPWPARAMVHPSSVVWISDGSGWNFTPLPGGARASRLVADNVDNLLRHSVEERLEADVDICCFLSGGIDSSLISSYAYRALGRLRTFCVRMPDPRIDESFAAQAAASAIGSEHTTLDCEPNPAEDLQRMIAQLGLPFGDSSLLPTYWVSKAVRSVSKVALTGDGGDELFCGYDRQVAARRFLHWMPLIRRIPRALFTDRDPRGFGSRARRLISAARHGYREFLAIYQLPDLERLLPDLGFAWYNLNPFADLDPAAVDFWEYLRNDLMVKSDTASMSVALEVRSPMLSTSLVRACLSAPYEDLMPHGQRKGLLRAVARRYLPAEVVDRPKQGFAIPIGDWFRSDFGGMKTLLMDHLNSAEPWPNIKIDLNRQFVQQMVDEHMNLRRDHSQRLYMLLVLSIWAKAVLA